MPVDDRQLIEGSCSRRYKRLWEVCYNSFFRVELVPLSIDKPVFIPVF